MKKRKYQGHYRKICGRRKPNEKFSGSGYTSHICRDCAKLPKEKRDEMQTITRIYSLPFWLKKDERIWLEKKKNDPREKVQEAAEAAYEDRFGWVEEQCRAVDELEAYLSDREYAADEDPADKVPADAFPSDAFPSDAFPANGFPADFKTDEDILPFK